MPIKPTKRFKEWAPRMVADLMRDFGLKDFQAAGIVGNGGHESAGFEKMQEIDPVGGGRGGLGAFQWTGPRRLKFESWLARNRDKGWTEHDYAANYSFLFRECKGPEARTIAELRDDLTLFQATQTFCEEFERPGVIHMGRRLEWANAALDAYRTAPEIPKSISKPAPVPPMEKGNIVELLGVLLAQVLPGIIKEVVGRAIRDPNVPLDSISPPHVAAKEVADGVMERIQELPEIQHATNTEPWYQSRVTLGAIITAISVATGASLSEADVNAYAQLAVFIVGPLVGTAVSLYGRWVATKPLFATRTVVKVGV